MKIAVIAAVGSTVRERRRFEMRCQCGFNSFDHHLVCPKCHKDLAVTRRLLNLDLPPPGRVNFFQPAGQGTAQPFPDSVGEGEDFEDLLPVEEIRPVNYGQSPPLETALSARTFSRIMANGAPEIAPAPPRAFADPPDEPMVELEMPDDFELDPAVNWPGPAAGLTPAGPAPHHRKVMDQIKTALTETGDLNPEKGLSAPGGGGTFAAWGANRAGASGEEEIDDLSSLLGDLNLDELDRDL